MSIFRRLMMSGGGTPPPQNPSKIIIKWNGVETEYLVQNTDVSFGDVLTRYGFSVSVDGSQLNINELTYIGDIPLIMDLPFYYVTGEKGSVFYTKGNDNTNLQKIDFENGNVPNSFIIGHDKDEIIITNGVDKICGPVNLTEFRASKQMVSGVAVGLYNTSRLAKSVTNQGVILNTYGTAVTGTREYYD